MPDFISTSPKKLSKSVDSWGSTILSEIRGWGGLPPGTTADVQFFEKDKDKGYALGTVVLNTGATPVNVPVVVKDWKLYPLDTMEVEATHYPLTRKRLAELSSTSDPYESKVVSPFYGMDPGQNIRDSVLPPGYQRGLGKAFAEDEMITPKLTVTSRRPEYDAFLMDLDEHTIRAYQKNGTHDVLMGVVKKLKDGDHPVQVTGDCMVERVPEEDVNIVWIPKPSSDDVQKGFMTVIGCSGKAFDPALMRIPTKLITTHYSNTDGTDFALGAAILSTQDGPRAISEVNWGGPAGHDIGVKELDLSSLTASTFHVLAGDANGQNGGLHLVKPGFVILNLVNPATPKESYKAVLTDDCLLVCGDTFYGAASRGSGLAPGAGDHMNGFANRDSKSISGDWSKGASYVFVCTKDPAAQAFGPVCIDESSSYPISIGGKSFMGTEYTGSCGPKSIKVVRSAAFEDAAITGNKIFVPEHYACVRVDGVRQAPESPGKVGYMAKMAHEHHMDWLKVFSTDNGGTFSVDMPPTIKTAYQARLNRAVSGEITLDSLPAKLAEFVLCAAGVKGEQASAMIKDASTSAVEAYGVEYLPVGDFNQTPVSDELRMAKRAFVDSFRINLVKVGAVMPDKKTVDAVLGLGVANEDNADDYIDSIPRYEEICQELSRLLPRARIKGGPIAEEAIRKAMSAIENFLEQAEAYLSAKKVIESQSIAQ